MMLSRSERSSLSLKRMSGRLLDISDFMWRKDNKVVDMKEDLVNSHVVLVDHGKLYNTG